MNLNILLLEDVHASATSILQTLRSVEIVRVKHAPDARALKTLLADVQVLGLRSHGGLRGPRRLDFLFFLSPALVAPKIRP